MKTVIPGNARRTLNPRTNSFLSSRPPHSGHLGQLAAMMNQSPRVQAQLKLADAIQNSESVQNQIAMAADINHAQRVAQPRLMEEEPAQREAAPIPNPTGLPDQLKSGVECLSGISLDDVKVHYSSAKPAQLNALAYAQGTDIHVASGHEKHLPHEAWHIVQQKQGRVRPTVQMKGLRVNDDHGLEHEADMMGEKATQREHLDPGGIAGSHQAVAGWPEVLQAMAAIQFDLDPVTLRLAAPERGGIDNLLRHNGYDPDHYSLVDYQTVRARYSTLSGLDTTLGKKVPGGGVKKREVKEAQRQARADIPNAYQAVRDSARDLELRAGNATWDGAVTVGADTYIGNRAAGYAAAAAPAWPGRSGPGTMPAAFQNAVQAEVTARDQAVQARFQAYQGDGRLLAGTIHVIRGAMGAFPALASVNARLRTVYERQTTVSRENWLLHLQIAGRRIDGSGTLHYTTFNNAVNSPVVGRVDNQNADQLMDMLFLLGNYADRIHATLVVGQQTYHKYYGGNYSAVPPAGDKARLDGEYVRMINAMRARVQTAKDAHGRVGHNDRAQQLDTGP